MMDLMGHYQAFAAGFLAGFFLRELLAVIWRALRYVSTSRV